jgi:hypothetical protein
VSVAWVGAGIAAVGTVSQMSAAKGGAAGMSGSSDQANMMQMMQQAQLRNDLAPWTQAGTAAQSRLNQYLGIGGVGTSGVTSLGLSTGLTPDQVRQQLLSRFTKQPATGSGGGPLYANGAAAVAALGEAGASKYFQDQAANASSGRDLGLATSIRLSNGIDGYNLDSGPAAGPGAAATIDEEGLNAAIAQYYAEQDAQNKALQADPTYGSLLTPFHNGAEFDPGPAFSFTGEDLKTDPGYKFGLDQGTEGIERGQASRGNFLSGAAMKELTRFNEDYAGTKFDAGFNRASATYGTNLAARQNAWNTNLGAYNTNRNTIYSFLTGQSQMGQNSAAQVGASGNQATNTMGNNLMAGANANAAGQVAGSNALVSGANSLVNAYRTNNPSTASGWNSLLNTNGGGYSGYTGYVGGNDPIANLNTSRGWTP